MGSLNAAGSTVITVVDGVRGAGTSRPAIIEATVDTMDTSPVMTIRRRIVPGPHVTLLARLNPHDECVSRRVILTIDALRARSAPSGPYPTPPVTIPHRHD